MTTVSENMMTDETARLLTEALNRHTAAIEKHAKELHPAISHREQAELERYERQKLDENLTRCIRNL